MKELLLKTIDVNKINDIVKKSIKEMNWKFTTNNVKKIILDDKIVGFVNYQDNDDNLVLNHFYILPKYRRNGMGTVIFHHLIEKSDVVIVDSPSYAMINLLLKNDFVFTFDNKLFFCNVGRYPLGFGLTGDCLDLIFNIPSDGGVTLGCFSCFVCEDKSVLLIFKLKNGFFIMDHETNNQIDIIKHLNEFREYIKMDSLGVDCLNIIPFFPCGLNYYNHDLFIPYTFKISSDDWVLLQELIIKSILEEGSVEDLVSKIVSNFC